MIPERIALLTLAVIWTSVAGYGLRLSWQNRSNALANLAALGTLGNGRRRIALGDIRRETLRIIIMADYAGIGVAAMLLESSPFRSGIISCGLILSVLMHVLIIRLDRTEGKALIAADTERDAVRDAQRDPPRDIARDLEHDR